MTTYSLSPKKNDASTLLALMRAVAAQAVLFGHGISMFHQYAWLDYPSAPYMQNIAVVLFFLLSGFLISHTLHKNWTNEEYTFSTYTIDRFARIYSGYLPALFLVAGLDFLVKISTPEYPFSKSFNVVTFFGNLFMMQDATFTKWIFGFYSVPSFGSARPFWTLSIEMWIYLFFGSLFLLRKSGFKPSHYVAIAFFSLVPLSNLFGGRGAGLFGLWMLGVFSERIVARGYRKLIPRYLLTLLFALFSALYVWTLVRYQNEVYVPESYLYLTAAFTCLISLSLRSAVTVGRPALQGIISFFSGFSLTLYCIHYSILSAFVLLYQGDRKSGLWISLIVCEICAIALAQITEKKHKQLGAYLKELYARRVVPLSIYNYF